MQSEMEKGNISKTKKYLFYLGHPAHFHLFKNAIEYFQEKGEVQVLIKKKDILESLLKNKNINYRNIFNKERGESKIVILLALLQKDWAVAREILRFKPNILIGSAPEIAHIGYLFRIPSLLFGEDDLHVVPEFGYVTYPFATNLVSPQCCDNGKWDKKTIKYNGYHELAYLHPDNFQPNKNVVQKYGPFKKRYFILRFSKLSAYHDTNREGINNRLAIKLVNLLKDRGEVYITSERCLAPELEKYRLAIDPLDIHHFLAFTSLFIGDSQTMCAEASVLGTPSIRYNDFVGELGYLEELENEYGLTKGVKTGETQKLFDLVNTLSKIGKKDIFQCRRKKMLNEKIDVVNFIIWFIENYPESAEQMKKNPAIQYHFGSEAKV
jgi:predicted glycosyltransferase